MEMAQDRIGHRELLQQQQQQQGEFRQSGPQNSGVKRERSITDTYGPFEQPKRPCPSHLGGDFTTNASSSFDPRGAASPLDTAAFSRPGATSGTPRSSIANVSKTRDQGHQGRPVSLSRPSRGIGPVQPYPPPLCDAPEGSFDERKPYDFGSEQVGFGQRLQRRQYEQPEERPVLVLRDERATGFVQRRRFGQLHQHQHQQPLGTQPDVVSSQFYQSIPVPYHHHGQYASANPLMHTPRQGYLGGGVDDGSANASQGTTYNGYGTTTQLSHYQDQYGPGMPHTGVPAGELMLGTANHSWPVPSSMPPYDHSSGYPSQTLPPEPESFPHQANFASSAELSFQPNPYTFTTPANGTDQGFNRDHLPVDCHPGTPHGRPLNGNNGYPLPWERMPHVDPTATATDGGHISLGLAGPPDQGSRATLPVRSLQVPAFPPNALIPYSPVAAYSPGVKQEVLSDSEVDEVPDYDSHNSASEVEDAYKAEAPVPEAPVEHSVALYRPIPLSLPVTETQYGLNDEESSPVAEAQTDVNIEESSALTGAQTEANVDEQAEIEEVYRGELSPVSDAVVPSPRSRRSSSSANITSRRHGVCIRCKFQKKKCEPADPSNPMGCCARCEEFDRDSRKTIHNMPCQRMRLKTISLYRMGGLNLTRRWASQKKYPCIKWNNSPYKDDIRFINITQGDCSVPLTLKVVRFNARRDDATARNWTDFSSGVPVYKERDMTPWCIIDTVEAAPAFMAYIHNNAVTAMAEFVYKNCQGHGQPMGIVEKTYAMLLQRYCQLRQQDVSGDLDRSDFAQLSLLHLAITLWFGLKHTTGSIWIEGNERLDMVPETEDRSHPLFNKVDVPRTISLQLDDMNSRWILQPISKTFIYELENLMIKDQRWKRHHYLTIYLCIFMVLREASNACADRFRHARANHGSTTRYSVPQFVEELQTGCTTILSHWAYFDIDSLSDTSAGPDKPREAGRLGELTDYQFNILEETRNHPAVKRHLAIWLQAKTNNGRVNPLDPKVYAGYTGRQNKYDWDDPYYWIAQLFEAEWTPHPIYERERIAPRPETTVRTKAYTTL